MTNYDSISCKIVLPYFCCKFFSDCATMFVMSFSASSMLVFAILSISARSFFAASAAACWSRLESTWRTNLERVPVTTLSPECLVRDVWLQGALTLVELIIDHHFTRSPSLYDSCNEIDPLDDLDYQRSSYLGWVCGANTRQESR